MKILTNIDLTKNQIVNVALQNLAVVPDNPVSGQIYYNTVDKRAYLYDGVKWIGMDANDAKLTGNTIVAAINGSTHLIDEKNLPETVRQAVRDSHSPTHTIDMVTGLKSQLDGKVPLSSVKTNVPAGAVFTDTKTTVNGQTGAISKADVVALGIPASDTTYSTFGLTNDGLVPQTTTSNVSDYLRRDGTWARPANDNTKYTAGTGINITGTSFSADFGTGVGKVVQGNDARLSDTRVAKSHSHGNISDDGKLGSVSSLVLQTGTGGIVEAKPTGTASQFMNGLGNWATPPNTIYSLPIAGTTAGGVKSGGGITVDSVGGVTINDNSHKHTVANITGLQGVLDSKETPGAAQTKASAAESAAKSYADSQITKLLGGASSAFDTLKELEDALKGNMGSVATILDQLASKTDSFVQAVGNASLKKFVIQHDHGTRNVTVTIRQTNSPYQMVHTDVEMTTDNTITVDFAVAPAASEYTVTVIG